MEAEADIASFALPSKRILEEFPVIGKVIPSSIEKNGKFSTSCLVNGMFTQAP